MAITDVNLMRRVVELFASFSVVETGLDGPIHNLWEYWQEFSAAFECVKLINTNKIIQRHLDGRQTYRLRVI